VNVLETSRLALRRFSLDDAPFILELLNEPSFLRFIGDKHVRTLEDARAYLLKGPMDSYARRGFGLYLATLKDGGVSIGMCGLIKREILEDVDIGFAFLPKFWSKGYASEAASAVMAYGRNVIGLSRIVAVVSPDNDGSIHVLEKLGLRFARMVRMSEDEPEIKLFSSDA
jgi:RimJ/RimL family protein N-acetyltransferase